jgi:hypothetical protein
VNDSIHYRSIRLVGNGCYISIKLVSCPYNVTHFLNAVDEGYIRAKSSVFGYIFVLSISILTNLKSVESSEMEEDGIDMQRLSILCFHSV